MRRPLSLRTPITFAGATVASYVVCFLFLIIGFQGIIIGFQGIGGFIVFAAFVLGVLVGAPVLAVRNAESNKALLLGAAAGAALMVVQFFWMIATWDMD